MIADEYFDPDMKRFISVDEMWQRNTKQTLRCAADVKRRLQDLRELRQSIHETNSVLALREQQTIRSIQEETERMITRMRRREAELISLVTADIVQQRDQLETIASRIDAVSDVLRHEVQILISSSAPAAEEGGVPSSSSTAPAADGPHDAHELKPHAITNKMRFQALSHCERALKESCYFSMPEIFSFQVTAKPFPQDALVSIAQVKCPMRVPTALTVVAKENKFVCELPSLTSTTNQNSLTAMSLSAGSAGGAFDGIVSPRGNSLSLPLGIFHYLSTRGGRDSFRNAAVQHEDQTEPLVRVYSNIPVQMGSLETLLYDRTAWEGTAALGGPLPATAGNGIRTKNVAGGRLTFDLSNHRRLRITAYALQHGHLDTHAALRNWRLEGSNDEQEWIPLDEQKECRLLGAKPFNEVVFVVSPLVAIAGWQRRAAVGTASGLSSVKQIVSSSGHSATFAAATEEDLPAFRFLSLVSTGRNAADLNHIELARVEFFGTVLVG